MVVPRGAHRRGGAPAVGGGVVDLRRGDRAGDAAGGVDAAGDQHPPVGQERGGLAGARGGQRRGGRPGALRGVVEFGGVERLAAAGVAGAAADDQHPPVRQERGGVPGARRGERAGGAPQIGAGVVDLRRGQRGAGLLVAVAAADDEDLAVGQERGGVRRAGCQEPRERAAHGPRARGPAPQGRGLRQGAQQEGSHQGAHDGPPERRHPSRPHRIPPQWRVLQRSQQASEDRAAMDRPSVGVARARRRRFGCGIPRSEWREYLLCQDGTQAPA